MERGRRRSEGAKKEEAKWANNDEAARKKTMVFGGG